jgi:hypothetical protein
VADERETKETVEFDPRTVLWTEPAEPKPTALIERDRLRELINASVEPEPTLRPHTIRRELLRSNARTVANDDLDTEIRPTLSPILVAVVITLLVIAFIAATHVR